MSAGIPAPVGLLAELTHRCPLACPYCSNPLDLQRREDEMDTADWLRILGEARSLGVLHVHLSGGEPAARRDIVEIVAECARQGLYSNLITSGVGRARAVVGDLAGAGLDHVQLSLQGAEPGLADTVAGLDGAHAAKLAFAEQVASLGLPLTVNLVVHRGNLGQVDAVADLAVAMGARRLEVAHAQYHGWGLANRAALMPTRGDVRRSVEAVAAIRQRHAGRLVVDFVAPDHYAVAPKPCCGGWGRRLICVTPSGLAMPCHSAGTIPGLHFWSARDRSLSEIWTSSPAFNAFRGTAWMPEPCRSCDMREKDWGGCRCQAMAATGSASAVDPACRLAPGHARLRELAEREAASGPVTYRYRGR